MLPCWTYMNSQDGCVVIWPDIHVAWGNLYDFPAWTLDKYSKNSSEGHLLYFNFVLFSSFPQWLGPKLKRHSLSDYISFSGSEWRSKSQFVVGWCWGGVTSWVVLVVFVWGLGVAELQWFNMYPSSKYGWKCKIESWKVSWMCQSQSIGHFPSRLCEVGFHLLMYQRLSEGPSLWNFIRIIDNDSTDEPSKRIGFTTPGSRFLLGTAGELYLCSFPSSGPMIVAWCHEISMVT